MTARMGLLLLSLLGQLGCQERHDSANGDALPPALGSAVSALEARAGKIAATWSEAELHFLGAKHQFERAESSFRKAEKTYESSSAQFQQARELYEQARERWEFYQKLVIVAATIDANNLERFRAETGNNLVRGLDCSEGMSTRAFRAFLTAQGFDLTGKDIDHIVPRSLGGADHPANFQVLPSSQNRSLQATFDRAKCAATKGKCAGAMAISRKCGTFRGREALP